MDKHSYNSIYYARRRAYCREHSLCVDCMSPLDENGTKTRCSFCRYKRNYLVSENRKTWSQERRERDSIKQKQWRFANWDKIEEYKRRYKQRRKEQNEGD